jgi:hypothetical protein
MMIKFFFAQQQTLGPGVSRILDSTSTEKSQQTGSPFYGSSWKGVAQNMSNTGLASANTSLGKFWILEIS